MSTTELFKNLRDLNLKTGAKSLASQGTKIIVGIDFGTTFSGIAWANTHDV
jgi:hypothetical protein